MYRRNRAAALVLIAALFTPFFALSQVQAQQFSLLFTNNLKGEYQPCG